jgi:hemerythrin superfamily protein
MIITILLLTCCVAGLLTGLVYYRSKYWNYLDISNKAEEELVAFDKEITEKIQDLVEKLENKHFSEIKAIKKKCQTKFSNLLNKKTQELEEEYKEKYNLLAKELEQDYNNACEEVKTELFEQLEKVDVALAEHAENIAMKNILTFSCSCSKDLIPCPIDFTKENTFTCPKCSSKYRVAINANPILIGRAISDEQFGDLLEKRLNENKGTK